MNDEINQIIYCTKTIKIDEFRNIDKKDFTKKRPNIKPRNLSKEFEKMGNKNLKNYRAKPY